MSADTDSLLMFFKPVVALGFMSLWVNAPMAVAYLWRRWRTRAGRSLYLGFEGPITCSGFLLMANIIGPLQYFAFLLPWLFHVGTWIAIRRVVGRVR